MTREVFVLEEKEGEDWVIYVDNCYRFRNIAEKHQQIQVAKGEIESRVVRYVPEDAFRELLLDAWSAACDLQQHGRYTSSEDDALELREKIEALGIIPADWIKQANELVKK